MSEPSAHLQSRSGKIELHTDASEPAPQNVGDNDGPTVGLDEGDRVGELLGWVVGEKLGLGLGDIVGADVVGKREGLRVGDPDGERVGAMLGPEDGTGVGVVLGLEVGPVVGAGVTQIPQLTGQRLRDTTSLHLALSQNPFFSVILFICSTVHELFVGVNDGEADGWRLG